MFTVISVSTQRQSDMRSEQQIATVLQHREQGDDLHHLVLTAVAQSKASPASVIFTVSMLLLTSEKLSLSFTNLQQTN